MKRFHCSIFTSSILLFASGLFLPHAVATENNTVFEDSTASNTAVVSKTFADENNASADNNLFKEDASFQEWMEAGNNAFHEGDYSQAIKFYQEALLEDQNATGFFNLGMAYIYADQVGPGILNLFRARAILPRNPEIQEAISDIFQQGKLQAFHSSWWEQLSHKGNLNEWIILVSVSAWGFLFLMSGVLLSEKRHRFLWILSIVLGVCFAGSSGMLYIKQEQLRRGVIVEVSPAFDIPSTLAPMVKTIAEGQPMKILQRYKDLYQVELPDGTAYYIPAKNCERIQPNR